jgi:tetratricopeptide (TPR) repeat protein
MKQGDFKSAEPILERARLISQEAGRGDTLESAGVLCNLGIVYDEQHRYSEAKPILEHALSISQKRLGAQSYRVATVERQLGMLAVDEKNYAEAEKAFRTLFSCGLF